MATVPRVMHNLGRRFRDRGYTRRGFTSPITLRGFARSPQLYELFAELGFEAGVEVGVKEARNTTDIVRAVPGLTSLQAIDPWGGYNDDERDDEPQHVHDRRYTFACDRLAPYPCVEVVRATSMVAVQAVPLLSLDFVYIDGNHTFDYVMEDLIHWSRRVRPGGLVCVHDYVNWKTGAVVAAVDAYARAHQLLEVFVSDEPFPTAFWEKP